VLREIGDVRLVVIDPISAYMGNVDSHKNTDVRAILTPIADFADACRVAILGVSHLNKSNAQEALQRVSGSLAFVAAARAALIVVKDRGNPARRLLLPLKNNLGRDTGGLAFAVQTEWLDSGIETSRIEWEPDPVMLTADEAMRVDTDPERAGEREDAKRFLRELLKDGPVMATEAEREYQEAGFSEKTVKRAKKELGIISEKLPAGWCWALSKGANTTPCKKGGPLDPLQQGQGLTNEKSAIFGQGGQLDNVAPLKNYGSNAASNPPCEAEEDDTENASLLTL
jgi:putative DNA primase/helicase